MFCKLILVSLLGQGAGVGVGGKKKKVSAVILWRHALTNNQKKKSVEKKKKKEMGATVLECTIGKQWYFNDICVPFLPVVCV